VTVDVAIVGGGVTGLTVAHRVREHDPAASVTVLEAAPEPGGMLRSVSVGGIRVPAGPDSFLARKPSAVDLCRELGIGDELVQPRATGSYLWTERGLVPYPTGTAFGIPSDLGDTFRWPGLSWAGRVRALRDLVARTRRDDEDESLGTLLRRRLGDEATDRAIAPLLAGLYAGDVDALSVRATFPELQGWERAQGSLLRGAQAAARRPKSDAGPMFLRPRDGVERLIDALVDDVGKASIRTSTPATKIERADDGARDGADGGVWRVRTPDGPVDARAVILTVDAPAAARLVPPGAASAELARIPFVSTGVVALVYGEGTGSALPEGSGFVVPRGAAPMTASTWISNKWPDPSFGARAVIRCFVGAAGEEDILDADDGELIDACARHLAALLPLPDAPADAAVVRWPRAMPQYLVGHVERAERIRYELPPGIFVCGRSLDGVGVPDCVRSAGMTADATAAYLDREVHA
jgi:oxygen-dependent protoporphyrinogen oxidase